MEKEYKNSEKNTYKYLGDLPFGKKKLDSLTCQMPGGLNM